MKEAKETRSAADLLTRQDILQYGLSFPGTYQEAPFHDPNWQLVRVKGSKKVFLWTYEKDGFLNLNVKVKPEWRDFWRNAYAAVIPGYHQRALEYDHCGWQYSGRRGQTDDRGKL